MLYYIIGEEVGSPPRMRGAESLFLAGTMGQGITPAYAGSRSHIVLLKNRCQDHPRVCGEQLYFPYSVEYAIGSPPRMRGAADINVTQKVKDRITPAYAGSSEITISSGNGILDHPRVCGEQNVADEETNIAIGSPPRMRGAV